MPITETPVTRPGRPPLTGTVANEHSSVMPGDDAGQPELARLGLYYPFIQFRDDSWLKLAALYWDRIGRIVPPGYELQDSETVRRLQGELGFVANLEPPLRAMDEVSREFVELIRARGPELHDLYGVQVQADAVPVLYSQRYPEPWSNAGRGGPVPDGPQWKAPLDPSLVPGADPRLAYIFAEGKMTPGLTRALVGEELGVPVRGHGLIGMHPQLAFVYMHALASQMAASVMHLLTDDDYDHVAAGCAPGRIAGSLLDVPAGESPDADGDEDLGLEFATLAIQSVIPKDIGSLPVEKIIEIRRRHRDELTAFQAATREIIGALPEAVASASPDVAAQYLQAEYEKTLEPELRQLQSALSRSGIDSVLGSMSVKVATPELVTSGAALLGIGALHVNPVLMGAGAIVLCLVPRIRRQRAEAAQLRANSRAAYLLRLEEELKPASLASGVAAKARRLIAA